MGTQHVINTVVVGPTARATLGRTLFTTRIARQKLAQVSYRWSRAAGDSVRRLGRHRKKEEATNGFC
jgi:hypothetical protein